MAEKPTRADNPSGFSVQGDPVNVGEGVFEQVLCDPAIDEEVTSLSMHLGLRASMREMPIAAKMLFCAQVLTRTTYTSLGVFASANLSGEERKKFDEIVNYTIQNVSDVTQIGDGSRLHVIQSLAVFVGLIYLSDQIAANLRAVELAAEKSP